MYKIRKKFTFEAAHVLNSSESKECQRIHGHSYIVEVFLWSEKLNSDGMVVDFKIVKEVFQPVIDKLDHSFIVADPVYGDARDEIVVLGVNPTAENIAKYINDSADKKALPDGVVTTIRVHETDSGYAEYISASCEETL